MIWIRQYLKQVFISGETAAVFWRAGTRAIEADRIIDVRLRC
jgi:hypothetical protein